MKLSSLVSAAALAVLAGSAMAHEYQAGSLKIRHPWARMTAPGQPSGGAFLKLQNNGTAADRLLGGSTPAADHVELHSMSMDGNVMKMREVPAIDIPAGQTVELKPGAWHMMLIGLRAPLKAGDKVPMTLRFEKAGEVKVELKIEELAPGQAASGAHQH